MSIMDGILFDYKPSFAIKSTDKGGFKSEETGKFLLLQNIYSKPLS